MQQDMKRKLDAIQNELYAARAAARAAGTRVEMLEEAAAVESSRMPAESSGGPEAGAASEGDFVPSPVELEWHRIVFNEIQGERKVAPRPGQLQVLESVMSRRSCVLIDAPGKGKTMALLVAALHQKGRVVSVVIQPTIDLQLEIFDRLEADLGAGRVLHTYSGPFHEATAAAEGGEGDGGAECAAGDSAVVESLTVTHVAGSLEALVLRRDRKVRLVVTTPERFCSPQFVAMMAELQSDGRLGPVAIDEGHLVNLWHNWREAYRLMRRALAEAFAGLVTRPRPSSPWAIVLTGSMSKRQADETIGELGLVVPNTDVHIQSLDRPEICLVVVDLNHVSGSRDDVLRAGALAMAQGCLLATKSILFVATAADVRFVCKVFCEELCGTGLEPFPFYRKLDNESSGGRAASRAAWASSSRGVLISTVLGAHGLNNLQVDFTGHLTMRGDVRIYLQELGRACRALNVRGFAWFARHPRFLEAAAKFIDFDDGRASAALRSMAGFTCAEGCCRRADLLGLLGDRFPPAWRPGDFVCCDVCNPEVQAVASEVCVVDLTAVAVSLLTEVRNASQQGRPTWFVSFLERGNWREACSVAEANSLIMHLFAIGALDLSAADAQTSTSPCRALRLSLGREKSAVIIHGDEDVLVYCRRAY